MSEKTAHDDDTGNGVLAAEKTAVPATAARSTRSRVARKGKRNTGNELTVRDRLEILQQATVDLQQHGIGVRAIPYPDRNMVVLALSSVAYCQYCRRLRLWEDMASDKCQYCA